MGHVYLTFNGTRLKFDSDFLKFPKKEEETAFTIKIDTLETNTFEFIFGFGANANEYDFIIDWGDGITEETQTSHTYDEPGEYTIKIWGKDEDSFPGFRRSLSHRLKIKEILTWGGAYWKYLRDSFNGCNNLVGRTGGFIDKPRIKNGTSAFRMFNECSVFNSFVGDWDVSGINSTYQMFRSCSLFNNGGVSGSIGPKMDWDVSNVTTFYGMFANPGNFNADISEWKIGNNNGVNNVSMFQMFANSGANFNININTKLVNEGTEEEYVAWDMSGVSIIGWMFNGASAFNQPIGNWDTSNVTDMSYVFHKNNEFNQYIGDWNTSNVTNMYGMFWGARDFQQDISRKTVNSGEPNEYEAWNTSKVTNMYSMFSGDWTQNPTFNQDIGNWDVSNVTNMGDMFRIAVNFSQDLSGWCVTKIPSYPTHFATSSAFQDDTHLHPVWGTCP